MFMIRHLFRFFQQFMEVLFCLLQTSGKEARLMPHLVLVFPLVKNYI